MHDSGTPPEIEAIGYEEFRERLGAPSVAIVDVLPVTTFQHSHISGAKNLPLAHVIELAADVLPDKSQEIITYCASFT